MSRNRVWMAAAGVLFVLMLAGAAVAVASSENEGAADDGGTEQSITGADLDRASEAALEYTGGGEVTDTEVDDEESYYEVEVTREGGSQVDVQLDRDFDVLGSKEDDSDED